MEFLNLIWIYRLVLMLLVQDAGVNNLKLMRQLSSRLMCLIWDIPSHISNTVHDVSHSRRVEHIKFVELLNTVIANRWWLHIIGRQCWSDRRNLWDQLSKTVFNHMFHYYIYVGNEVEELTLTVNYVSYYMEPRPKFVFCATLLTWISMMDTIQITWTLSHGFRMQHTKLTVGQWYRILNTLMHLL